MLKQLTVVYSFGDDPTEYTVVRNQHDLLVLPHNPEGFDSRLTPLQVDALVLSKEIREFVDGFEPMPPQTDDISLATARGKWGQRLRSQYEIKFKNRLEDVLLRLQAENIGPNSSFISRGVVRPNVEIMAVRTAS
jgi:hypothetical protein